MTSIRLLFSIATIHHWTQLYIRSLIVYMEQPPALVAKGESSNMVCLLHKFLYGLKQSPYTWFGHFRNVIHQFGMTKSDVNHSLFYRHSSLHHLHYANMALTGACHLS